MRFEFFQKSIFSNSNLTCCQTLMGLEQTSAWHCCSACIVLFKHGNTLFQCCQCFCNGTDTDPVHLHHVDQHPTAPKTVVADQITCCGKPSANRDKCVAPLLGGEKGVALVEVVLLEAEPTLKCQAKKEATMEVALDPC